MIDRFMMSKTLADALDQYGVCLKQAISLYLEGLPDDKLVNLQQDYVDAHLTALGAIIGGDMSKYYVSILFTEAVQEEVQSRRTKKRGGKQQRSNKNTAKAVMVPKAKSSRKMRKDARKAAE